MSWPPRPPLAVAAALVAASSASACPICDSPTGRQVRGGIADADFGHHLLVTAAPFAVFLAVAAVLHFGVPWGRRPGVGSPRSPTPC